MAANIIIASAHEVTSDKLVELNHNSYLQHVVNNETNTLINGPWFIMFFAPWCGHCKKLMPTWNDFAEIEGSKSIPYMKIAIVDCDDKDNNDLCGAFDITGYPRLLFLKGGKHYRFKGERSVEKLTQFVYEGQY